MLILFFQILFFFSKKLVRLLTLYPVIIFFAFLKRFYLKYLCVYFSVFVYNYKELIKYTSWRMLPNNNIFSFTLNYIVFLCFLWFYMIIVCGFIYILIKCIFLFKFININTQFEQFFFDLEVLNLDFIFIPFILLYNFWTIVYIVVFFFFLLNYILKVNTLINFVYFRFLMFFKNINLHTNVYLYRIKLKRPFNKNIKPQMFLHKAVLEHLKFIIEYLYLTFKAGFIFFDFILIFFKKLYLFTVNFFLHEKIKIINSTFKFWFRNFFVFWRPLFKRFSYFGYNRINKIKWHFYK